MSANAITVPGLLKPDGTLELGRPVELPPGPVEVTVRPLAPASEGTWAVPQRIWAERKALGLPGRTKEEIDAGIQELRDELEDHALAVERFQREARSGGEAPSC